MVIFVFADLVKLALHELKARLKRNVFFLLYQFYMLIECRSDGVFQKSSLKQ